MDLPYGASSRECHPGPSKFTTPTTNQSKSRVAKEDMLLLPPITTLPAPPPIPVPISVPEFNQPTFTPAVSLLDGISQTVNSSTPNVCINCQHHRNLATGSNIASNITNTSTKESMKSKENLDSNPNPTTQSTNVTTISLSRTLPLASSTIMPIAAKAGASTTSNSTNPRHSQAGSNTDEAEANESTPNHSQDLVSDVWDEFFRLYRHPFGRTDSMFQKSAKKWLRGLNRGDPEYICEQCTIQPGYKMGCDRKNIRCRLCVERHRVCSRTKIFKKQMIMEKLKLDEKEYNDLMVLVPPRRRGIRAHSSIGLGNGSVMGPGRPRTQSTIKAMMVVNPVKALTSSTSVLTRNRLKDMYQDNLKQYVKKRKDKGKGVDRNEYGNGSRNGRGGRRKRRGTPKLSSSSGSGSHFSPSNATSESGSRSRSRSKLESDSEIEVESEEEEDELKHDDNENINMTIENKENQIINANTNIISQSVIAARVGQKRPVPQSFNSATVASTSKARSNDTSIEVDEASSCHRVSKRIRSSCNTLAMNPSAGSMHQSTRETWNKPVAGHRARMIRGPLKNINIQATEISHGHSNDSTSPLLLSGGVEGMETEKYVDSVDRKDGPGNIDNLQQQQQIMDTLRAMESTLDVIRENLKAVVNASTNSIASDNHTVAESSLGQSTSNCIPENNHTVGVGELNEVAGIVTTRESLELLEENQQWKLFINSPQDPDDGERMILDAEDVEGADNGVQK